MPHRQRERVAGDTGDRHTYECRVQRLSRIAERVERRAEQPTLRSGREPQRRAGEDDEGVAEAVELCRQHEEYQDDGQPEGGEEFIPLGSELA